MNTINATMQDRRHPLDNRIPPPLFAVLIGGAMAVIARFTTAVEIGSNVRFAIGGIAIALGPWWSCRSQNILAARADDDRPRGP